MSLAWGRCSVGGCGMDIGTRIDSADHVSYMISNSCAFVASEERLGFLRRVTEAASQQAGFLEGYRCGWACPHFFDLCIPSGYR